MSPHSRFSPGPRTRVRRKDRALPLPEAAIAVIDEALICHLAFVLAPAGSSGRDADASSAPTLSDEPAQCLPMAHARIGETIYVHGACSNRMLRSLVGRPCSLTFTLLDGLVFARSAFHHSMNYRCAVAVGAARLVEDETEKRQALHALVEHTAPGRAKECIEVTDAEARSTLVLAIDVQEAACKARQGHPVDEAEHVARQEHFAGTVPLKLTAQAVVRDAQLERPLPIPPSIRACQARHGARVPVELIREETLYSSDASRLDWAWVHECLSQHSYWAAGVTLKDLTVSLDNSIVFGAYHDARQVAFARVLTDQSRIAYLADVFVDARYRGRGYGKGIVDFALEHPCVAGCDRVLLGTRDAVELYTRCGFAVASNTSMVRVRM